MTAPAVEPLLYVLYTIMTVSSLFVLMNMRDALTWGLKRTLLLTCLLLYMGSIADAFYIFLVFGEPYCLVLSCIVAYIIVRECMRLHRLLREVICVECDKE